MSDDSLFDAANAAYDNGDYENAFLLFLKAAENGDCDAMSRIAAMYESGEGTIHDIEKSIEWDLKAIDNGSKISLLNIGITYRRLGDIRSAKTWFEKSFSAGDTEAALELARLYSVSDKENSIVRRYLKEVISSDYVTQDSLEEAKKLLSTLASDPPHTAQ